MRLLVTLDFPPKVGGIQKYLFFIVKHEYSKSDMVLVAGSKRFLSLLPDIKARVQYTNVIFEKFIKKFSLISMTIPYFSLCRKFKGNLRVECGNIYAAIIPWIISKITGQSYSIYTYGTELLPLFTKSWKSNIFRNILTNAKQIQTLGTYTKNMLKQLGIVQPIIIIHPRIELPVPQGIGSIKKKNKHYKTILTIGRMVQHKGHEQILKIAQHLKNDLRFRFIIIGDGPLFNSLLSKCSLLNLEHTVFIKNNCSDSQLREEYEKSDIFLLPSHETSEGVEGFGIVLLEAMAHKIPIIAAASGGIPEVLDNGSCGILVQPGNINDMVGYIKNTDIHSKKIKSMVQKAYNRLISQYVW